MISLLGRGLVLVGLAACAVGSAAGFAAGLRRNEAALLLARRMAALFGLSMVAATLLMEGALLTHDFSVSYVAKVGSLSTPTIITIVSLWSSLEGSILFWGLILGAGSWGWSVWSRGQDAEQAAWSHGVLLAVGAYFCWLIAGVANPFTPTELPIPTDGPGPNALLQNHPLMILHPPALYMGYVNMAIPFGMACASLLSGRLEPTWIAGLRRWTLYAWSFLTLGILLGGWWSYEVLGWGGYWAWDPVENASFMPWLTATAFLHSAMVTERRGHLKGWTVALALSSFLLTMLGTFMTRSGVFNSVHSFTQSPIGPVFLSFIAAALLACVVLLGLRLHTLAPPVEGIPGPVSRESSFLVNNLLLVAFTFTVLLGTLYPLLNEGLTGEKLSVGEPYFNRMSLPICAGLLFLLGVGPALPWGEANLGRVGPRLGLAAAVGAVGLALGFVLGFGDSPWALATFFLSGFAGTTISRELFGPVLDRARSKGENVLVAFNEVAQRSRARVAAHLVHLGVVMAAVAIAGSGAGKLQADLSLPTGQPVAALGYELVFLGSERVQEPHRMSEVARIELRRDGSSLGVLEPRMNHYETMREPIGTPAVKTTVARDIYLSLVRLDSGSAAVRVLVEPLVVWLWIAGLLMFAAGLWGIWPRLRSAASPAAAAAPQAAK